MENGFYRNGKRIGVNTEKKDLGREKERDKKQQENGREMINKGTERNTRGKKRREECREREEKLQRMRKSEWGAGRYQQRDSFLEPLPLACRRDPSCL